MFINYLKNLKYLQKNKYTKTISFINNFKKNKNSGKKIKKYWRKNFKKTIKELDNLFNNEFKKT